MASSVGRLAAIATIALASGSCFWPNLALAADPPADPPQRDPALTGSTITALLDANNGKLPTTGKDLWSTLSKLGTFGQLPVVFSAVRLDSGIANPRVVITSLAKGLSDAEPTQANLYGRLFLAANMAKNPKGGDPFVASVEFISWNTLRRRFDFGVIENVGTSEPQLRIVDGGRCFACHKNKGPILGATPWTNTTHHDGLRLLVADRLRIVGTVPPGAAGVGLRDRIDGMALVNPNSAALDDAVRVGQMLKLNRERFRLVNRSNGGRKAFVALLVAITHSGPLDPPDRQTRTLVNVWGNEKSYLQFAHDWIAIAKSTNSGVLLDFDPIPKPIPKPGCWGVEVMLKPRPLPTPPPAGFTTPQMARAYANQVAQVELHNKQFQAQLEKRMLQLSVYDAGRATGKNVLPSIAQPSNPNAFVHLVPKATQQPWGMADTVLLAKTLGLTEGDRKFMADALATAAKRITRQKVTPASLAKELFEGPEFADVLAGGPLPDRDDFKDRFVAGLNTLLTKKYRLAEGFAPERNTYASSPRFDPKILEEVEAAIVPTTACLRCHDVRGGAKERLFELIPALDFDPLDKQARQQWVRTANPKRKQEVVTRMLERLVKDADMPPVDSPEHNLFRLKQAAAFDDAKQFLEAQLEAPKEPKKP